MRTNDESKFSFLLIGLGLGAIGGLMAALLARKETRDLLARAQQEDSRLSESTGEEAARDQRRNRRKRKGTYESSLLLG